MIKKSDLKLLFELDSNSRNSFSKIGKKIRMSEQLVSYKVTQLEKRKIISSFYPLIDYSRLGYLTFMVYFKVHYQNEALFYELIKRMKLHPNILRVMECDGTYDLITIFAAKNPSSFNKMLKKIVEENQKELRSWMILTTIVEHHSLRNYLVGKEPEKDVVIGGDREELIIDETNKKIIRALMNQKKKIVEIATESEITPKTVMARLKWLEQNEIIRGYRLLLNLRPLDIATNIILINYHNVSVKEEEEFRNFCKSSPQIIEFTKTIGEWDVVLTVETINRDEFRKLYLIMRERFEDIIADYDNFRVFQVHKKHFLPQEAVE